MSSHSIDTTCPYCGVGCGVSAQTDGTRVLQIRGSSSHPANKGKLCIKGTNLAETTAPTGRLSQPVVNGKPSDWDAALGLVASEMRRTIKEHGPQAVAFYLSGQLLTEDYYVANKLMKGYIGSANVDTNSRLCMASAVAAHKRAFGEDIVPCSYTDLESCDLVVLTGSNTAWAHPVLYQRLVAAKAQRGFKVVVIDPRVTATCDIADLHLPLAPGTDGTLFNGLLTHLTQTQRLDRAFINLHTEGFDAACATAFVDIQTVAMQTKLEVEQIAEFYELFGQHHKTLTLFSQGINQSTSGTDKGNAIINCHLATGRIGKPGQGPFSITGQPNAMGGREVGGMANQLAAHMDFKPAHLDRVQRFWGAPNMASEPGLKAVDMFTAVGEGKIKAIWIMGTNPAVSLPDSNQVRQALAACPFVVVSDCTAQTDTNRYANVLLPAQGWGEKDGTVTNSERCISRQRRLLEPLGQARADWDIICDVARKMGFTEGFEFAKPCEIFAEHARLSGFENNGERLFDIAGLADLTANEYNNLAPTYWPLNGKPFQHGTFPTASGKAQFVATNARIPRQQPNPDYPLLLNTGRTRDQWHTMTRTGLVPKLFGHQFSPRLQIHPQDANRFGIAAGDLVETSSALGSLHLLAELTEDTRPGLLFAPIHWSDQTAYRANVSQVFESVTDPVSGQPESKQAAVRCKPIPVGFWIRLVTACALKPSALNAIQDIKSWAAAPGPSGWHYELAVETIEDLTGLLSAVDLAHYCDAMGGQRMLSRGADEAGWLLFAHTSRKSLPQIEHIANQFTAAIPDWQKLSPLALADQDTSTMICSCLEVREQAIRDQIARGTRTSDGLGRALGCGTNCGSCVPELNQMIANAG